MEHQKQHDLGKDLDLDGVQSERIIKIKKVRAGKLGALNIKQRALSEVLKNETSTRQEVSDKLQDLEIAFSNFEECCFQLFEILKGLNYDKEYEEAIKYYKDHKQTYEENLELGGIWLRKEVKATELDAVSVGSSSRKSGISQSSSMLRKAAAARRAALEAELKAGKAILENDQKILELERQRKEAELKSRQLSIEAKLAAATAEEEVLIRFEEEENLYDKRYQCGRKSPQNAALTLEGLKIFDHKLPPHTMLTESTPLQAKTEEDERGRSFHLNPEAPEWYSRPQQNIYEDIHRKRPPDLETKVGLPASEANMWMEQQRQIIEALQIPKGELQKFSGEPLDYWNFIRNFEEMIGKTSVSPSLKLNCLMQSCIGRAASAIKCCSIMEPKEGYERAKQLLKERFGSEYQITESMLRKVVEGPNIKPQDNAGLQDYADEIRNCIEIFTATKKLDQLNSDERLVKIIKRLPAYYYHRWKSEAIKFMDRYKRRPGIEEAAGFIERIAREANDPLYAELDKKTQDPKKGMKTKKEEHKSRGTTFNIEAYEKKTATRTGNEIVSSRVKRENDTNITVKTTKEKSSCPLCSGDHFLYVCNEFVNMQANKRLELVRKLRLCFNCLHTSNHQVAQCTRQSGCSVKGCEMWHSKLLHDAFISRHTEYPSSDKGARKTATANLVAGSLACDLLKPAERVVLPIIDVLVQVKDSSQTVRTLALLDPGSTRTFCKQSLAKDLKIEGEPTVLSLETLNKGSNDVALEVSLNLVAGCRSKQVVKLHRVYAVKEFPKLHRCVATQNEIEKWEHLKDLHAPKMKGNVEIIIGNDNPDVLRPLELRYGNKWGEPYAVRTILGWIMNGPLKSGSQEDQAISNFVHAMPMSEQISLEEQVKRFWAVDGDQYLVKSQLEMSLDDQRVISTWDQSIELEKGHYQLPIPFKTNPPELHNNRGMAERRLKSLKRRLKKDPELLKQYKEEIQDLLNKGYAEKVPKEEIDAFPGMTWYLPPFNVKHPSKPEKFRIVFDCAAESGGLSLNKRVMKGPDLTNKLLGVLLRFRQDKVAVMGDIEAMFHQVRVTPEHRNVLRFLWWKDGDMSQDPDIFRMNVHLFGGIWSPSCAAYTLQHTAKDQVGKFSPQAVSTVLKNFYADDCLKSVEDEDEAIKLVGELREMLAARGFNLTKWMSSSKKVLSSVVPSERAKGVKSINLDQEALPIEHALGLVWETECDQLGIRTKTKKKENTKRGLLSMLSSVYDPLGLVSPFVLQAKKIFQDECRQEKGWDDELTPTNQVKWNLWQAELPMLDDFSIDRCFTPPGFGKVERYQLHQFCDASEGAYGAVSYLRMINHEGKIHCAIVAAKSKLAPIKQMTIPRLELSAAVVAVKLDAALHRELEFGLSESVFWTDSMIVLQYIKNKIKRFQTFVANRVAVIQENSSPTQWRHVGSKLNPADDASRGLNGNEMVNNPRWKQGPVFLWQEEEHWPEYPKVEYDMLKGDREVKREESAMTVVSEVEINATDRLLKSYSGWFRLKKATAWICRFGIWLKQKRPKAWLLKGAKLETEELKRAEDAIIRYVQKSCYANEIHQLKSNQESVPKKSSIYQLEPFLHQDGLLRIKGRLQNAPVSEQVRHPAILPKEHYVTDLIIREAHENVGHSGREHVLAQVRQRYWIPKVRVKINKVIRECTLCKRCRGSLAVQQMANLPEERVMPNKPAFTSVGVDCFGPFLVKRGRSQEKRYGCIFTCLAMRAVHIEKLDSMEADSFINALVRFVARRGKPEMIRSDNGTNFVGGNRELKDAVTRWNECHKLQTHLLQQNIKWVFNPPTASHMGGVWERQIRTVRKTLATLTKNHVLDDERINTLFCEVETIVNSRPITSVSSDPKDLEALTPNHLLLLRPGHAVALVKTGKKDQYGKRWKQVQFLADQFWRRWTREYLPSLQLRQKWLVPKRNFQVGDVVLVLEEGTPRQFWPLGRIVQVFKSKDNLVRAVEVRTANNKLVRPVTKLCLLEGSSELMSQANCQDSGENNAS